MESARFDLLIAGGGLAGGLAALALKAAQPALSVAVVEAGGRFGGNHTWSSFESDLSPAGRALAAPLIAHRWPGYAVRFPGLARRLETPYQSATSERLHAALMRALPESHLFLSAPIAELRRDGARLADGRLVAARAVLDARGNRPAPHLDLGWQKFVGLEVELEAPHGLSEPVIMDATVSQHDGYRFVYVLPFSPTTALIEDTYYADGPELPREDIAGRVRAYAGAQGWRIARELRAEQGVLPIAIGGDIDAHLAETPAGIAPIGMQAALFHPVTGYSFPDAVALALKIAAHPDLSTLEPMIRAHAAERWHSHAYSRLLTKMLFRAALPDERRQVLQRFYGLDAGLVARFYAGHSSLRDKARILTGKPPVPVGRALAAILKG